MISLPSQRCIPINGESRDTLKSSMNSLIDKIFPNLIRQYRDRHWISERAILSPKNREVDEINAHCISLLPGDIIIKSPYWKSTQLLFFHYFQVTLLLAPVRIQPSMKTTPLSIRLNFLIL